MGLATAKFSRLLFEIKHFLFLLNLNYTSVGLCKYANGSTVRGNFSPVNDLATCPNRSFRSCADIKIVANAASSQVYVPNPAKPIKDSPQVFFCRVFRADYDAKMNPTEIPNTRADPNKFIGFYLINILF